jgi:hypothetical protein
MEAMMKETLIEGGCRCGAVRYRATAAPYATALCHCRSCRSSSGAHALAWAIFRTDDIAVVKGALAVYASSPGVERGFCGRRGTSLSYRRVDRPDSFDVTTASLDDPGRLPPGKEIWTVERLAWVRPDPSLAQFSGSSAAAPG